MIDVTLLGTGGMMPLPNRRLTALLTKYNGHSFLIDAGEGTQIAIREAGLGFKDIDVIMITHFHADHMAGLPGLLLTIGNCGRTDDLTIIGPKDVKEMVNGLRMICPILPYNIKFIELTKNIETFYMYGMNINCFKVDHDLDCYGYNFELPRGGKFDPIVAKELGIPVQYWGKLQKGEIDSVEVNGNIISRDSVIGPARTGLKITYTTDTRPVDNINKFAKDADLFICEGMYGEDTPEEYEKAVMHKHMHILEAAKIAKDSNCKELWLTHYSPKIVDPKFYSKAIKDIFENTVISDSQISKSLNFKD